MKKYFQNNVFLRNSLWIQPFLMVAPPTWQPDINKPRSVLRQGIQDLLMMAVHKKLREACSENFQMHLGLLKVNVGQIRVKRLDGV